MQYVKKIQTYVEAYNCCREYRGEHLDKDKSREKAKMIQLWEDTKDSSIRSRK